MNNTKLKQEDILAAKISDLQILGAVVELDPIEAEIMGAFEEDALNLVDAESGKFDE